MGLSTVILGLAGAVFGSGTCPATPQYPDTNFIVRPQHETPAPDGVVKRALTDFSAVRLSLLIESRHCGGATWREIRCGMLRAMHLDARLYRLQLDPEW